MTGGTGHLGSLLLRRLLADPAVSSITSVARRPLGLTHPRLAHTSADLRAPEARRALAGVDICYHLGFQLWAAGGADAMADANLRGTANVLAGRPGAVVFASSAAVYGAWPDNPLPIREEHPARPNREVPYARHKLEAESRCLDAAPTAVVRLGAVLGAHADPAVIRSVAGYRVAVPAIRGVGQALQFLDESDAVSALVAAGRLLLGRGAPDGGVVCNVATSDWLSAVHIAAIAGGRVLPVPRRLLLPLSEAARRLRVLPFGADRAALIDGPLALDASRAGQLLGWTPTHTSASVLRKALGGGGE